MWNIRYNNGNNKVSYNGFDNRDKDFIECYLINEFKLLYVIFCYWLVCWLKV